MILPRIIIRLAPYLPEWAAFIAFALIVAPKGKEWMLRAKATYFLNGCSAKRRLQTTAQRTSITGIPALTAFGSRPSSGRWRTPSNTRPQQRSHRP